MSIIQLFSGRYIDLLDPQPDDIAIEDIAHGLSNICRFTGQTRVFYSVAQHSCLAVEYLTDQSLALECLLHDAAEAYLGDVTTPLKRLLPEYQKIEKQFEAVIAAKFGIRPDKQPLVKQADILALVTEKRDLMIKTADCDSCWGELSLIKPHPEKIHPMTSELARNEFLRRYKRILAAKNGIGECVKVEA